MSPGNELFKFLSFIGMLCVLAGGVLRLFFMDVYTVPHNGMAPTLVMGDEVLVWRNSVADMGNVMLCEHPSNPGQTVLGRVIAFPGHTVSTDHFGHLVVDSDRTTTEGVGQFHFYDESVKRMFTMDMYEIEYNHHHGHKIFLENGTMFSLVTSELEKGVFLLGDNRSHDWDDSRDFGEIEPERCTRQVFMRLRPAPSRDDDLHGGYLDLIR